MITKDSVTVYVNAIMYYKVFANIKTMFKVPMLMTIQLDAISKRIIIRCRCRVAYCCAIFL